MPGNQIVIVPLYISSNDLKLKNYFQLEDTKRLADAEARDRASLVGKFRNLESDLVSHSTGIQTQDITFLHFSSVTYLIFQIEVNFFGGGVMCGFRPR